MNIQVKRIYEPVESSDGFRVLVDRLWPRGVSKQRADLDLWLKDIAPSTELRKWFGHDPEKWTEFERKYKEELKNNQQAVDELSQIIKAHQIVTLLYGAKDQTHNEALVLKQFLGKRFEP